MATNPPHPSPHVGEYDPSLGRTRKHTDDLFDHRKALLGHVRRAIQLEKEGYYAPSKRTRSRT